MLSRLRVPNRSHSFHTALVAIVIALDYPHASAHDMIITIGAFFLFEPYIRTGNDVPSGHKLLSGLPVMRSRRGVVPRGIPKSAEENGAIQVSELKKKAHQLCTTTATLAKPAASRTDSCVPPDRRGSSTNYASSAATKSLSICHPNSYAYPPHSGSVDRRTSHRKK